MLFLPRLIERDGGDDDEAVGDILVEGADADDVEP